MKVIGLNNKEYHLKLTNKNSSNPSKLHLEARDLLIQEFPLSIIYEEVLVPGSGKLKLDFFLPVQRIAVEVQGKQHYKNIPFFFKQTSGFVRALMRDKNKIKWCELNDINLITLPYDRTQEWKTIIQNR